MPEFQAPTVADFNSRLEAVMMLRAKKEKNGLDGCYP
jgi:hypothetical protein